MIIYKLSQILFTNAKFTKIQNEQHYIKDSTNYFNIDIMHSITIIKQAHEHIATGQNITPAQVYQHKYCNNG